MEKHIHRQNDEKGGSSEELAIFAELQRLVEEELGESLNAQQKSRVFAPLTAGLGLESPKKRTGTDVKATGSDPGTQTEAEPADKVLENRKKDLEKLVAQARLVQPNQPAKKFRQKPALPEALQSPLPAKTKQKAKTADVAIASKKFRKTTKTKKVTQAKAELMTAERTPATTVMPPPLPTPSWFRRLLSVLIDEIFVITLWLFGLVITVKLFTGSVVGIGADSSLIVSNPNFFRLAVLEFVTLWFCYFAICIGVLDMTFGMWVWGIRVGYRTESKGKELTRKMLRIGLSFLFYAPIAPLVLLMIIGKEGRNLLDYFSGTQVYQAAT